jgi:hypothetical protein
VEQYTLSRVLTAEVPGLRAEREIEIPDQAGTSVHRRERQAGISRRTIAWNP